jgi:hypothetical protein
MLGTGARYAEYGITGGFFLFTQALILGFADPDLLVSAAHSFGLQLAKSVEKIPEQAKPAVQSLLVALALLSVFIIGLVLEIIGSVFMIYEAYLFRKRLEMNHWVARYVDAELPDYAEDYRVVLDVPGFWPPWKWWKKGRSSAFGNIGFLQGWQRFRRLESILIAKVLTSGAKTEMLAEQISIYRMSRAIGTALYVVSFEFMFGSLAFDETSLARGILPGLGLLIVLSATFITLGSYSRFANKLLSMVYASWKRQTAPSAG